MDVSLTRGRIHVVNRGSGFPLLILHGGMLDHRHMVDALEPVFEPLTGWRRLYLDLPGCGQSVADASVGSQDDVLDMLLEYVSSALASEQFAVIGESRGSYHARGIVHRMPDRVEGMALIGPGGVTNESQSRLPQHRVLVRDDDPPADLNENEAAQYGRLVVQRPDILESISRTKIPAIQLAVSELEARLQTSFEFSFDLDDPEHRFEKPSLIICGRQDAIAGYQDALEFLPSYPRATIAVLDRAGHSLAWEQPGLFSALIQEWLRRMEENMAATSG